MADAKTAEAEKPEVPKLMRSFSKGYQKTKEAFKKGFSTTPRGSRSLSGRMASTEIPDLEPTAPAEAPQVPSKPAKEGVETGMNAATADVAVKTTVKASGDGGRPVEIKLEPAAGGKPPLAQAQEPVAPYTPTAGPTPAPAPAAPKAEEAPAPTPVPAPEPKAALAPAAAPAPEPTPAPALTPAPAPTQEAPKTEEVAWAAGADVADKVQAPLEEAPAEGEAAPADGAAVAGSEPPEVRVLVNGLQKDAAAREAAAEKPEPVELHVEPVRSSSGGKSKKVALGLFALAAVSAVSLVMKGKLER